eukprot:1223260-Ditylum_brightwellii.AAC.1
MVEVEKFNRWVVAHLDKNAECILRKKVMEIHQEATKFVERLAGCLSCGENGLLQESLEAKAIPQPQLLVKDHKDKGEQGDFPTRLVIPAANFTATFSKIGYIRIKRVLEEHRVNSTKHTIIQSSDLKQKLENLNC